MEYSPKKMQENLTDHQFYFKKNYVFKREIEVKDLYSVIRTWKTISTVDIGSIDGIT